jgi:DNA modification methylase
MNLQDLERMPLRLKYRLLEAVSWRSDKQSDIARLQQLAIEYFENNTRQGERTDLLGDETCTQNDVQVHPGKRRANSTERAAKFWAESGTTVRKRVYVLNAAEKDPEKWRQYQRQMDDAGSPHAAYNRLVAAQREDDRLRNDAAPEPSEPVVRLGDLWLLGEHRLLCGDATVKNDVMRVLDGASPHLMITDPPYGVNYDPESRVEARGGSIRSIGKVMNDDRADWRGAWEQFDGDVVYLFHAGKHSATAQLSLEVTGFEIRSQCIWYKSNFAISRGDYQQQHEPFFYAVRGPSHWAGARDQSTVWEVGQVPKDEKTGHGTQKPVALIIRAIENSSQPGDGVYDPFVGSGTTIMAASETDRICYAMDLDPVYCTVAIERWQILTGKQAVFEATGKTYAEVKRERLAPSGPSVATALGRKARRYPGAA